MESESTSHEVDRTGTVIEGRYAVERLIGRGGFSSVYRARRVFDGEIVAIKVLEMGPKIEANAMERFTREAEFVQGLSSPNTIRIFETGQEGTEFLYTVMEYIAGRSLYAQIHRKGALNARQVAEVTIQLCNSLAEVHEKGLLHRDLKPSNIMLFRADDGHVVAKVLDFGVAKMLEPQAGLNQIKLTAAGAFIGTPRYASPEQMRREPLTRASDVYAVGMIMWEALVGQPAIEQVDYSACVKAHISSDPWRLATDAGYPPDLAAIIEKSLAKPVDQRYSSCEELRSALEAFLEIRAVQRSTRSGPLRPAGLDSPPVTTSVGGTSVSDKEQYQPETVEDVEAEDELFGEVIESSEAEIDSVNVMATSDLSEASAPHGGTTIPLAPRKSNHAGVSDEDRSAVAAPAEASSGSGVWLMVALVLLVVGGGYLLTMGANEEAPKDPAAVTKTTDTNKPDEPPAEDQPGDPTLDAATLIKGMVAAGWRVGAPSVDTMDDVTQTNVLAQKDAAAVTVTIYESKSSEWRNKLVVETEPPSKALSFGRTVARVSLGPPDQQNGVVEMYTALSNFKKAAANGPTGDTPSEDTPGEEAAPE